MPEFEQSQPQHSHNSRKRKILLVDDVELFLELEQTFFSRLDKMETLVARNGQQALEAIRREKPDLVFLDLHLPDIPGNECCRNIKKDPEFWHTPIVMVTGGRKEEDFECCWKAGCDDIIVKPINPNQFLAMAKKYLQLPIRIAPRYTTRLKVIYYIGDREQTLTDYTVDISTGGVFLETANLLPLDTHISLEIHLNDDDPPLRSKARVAWRNDRTLCNRPHLPEGMGLQFIELSLTALHNLRRHLQDSDMTPIW